MHQCSRLQIPSDKVVFNEKPEMKAREICDAAKEAIHSGKFDMIRVNFANPDMVGHTGDLKAAIYVRLVACCACGYFRIALLNSACLRAAVWTRSA